MAQCANDYPSFTSLSSFQVILPETAAWLVTSHDNLRTSHRVHKSRLPIGITTSGLDGNHTVGQLAFCFDLGCYDVDELTVAFAHFTMGLLEEKQSLPVSRYNLHSATNYVWVAHKGTVRCAPDCQSEDIHYLFTGSRDHRHQFACDAH